jgi:TonB family protein
MTLHQLWDFLMPYERRWLGLMILISVLLHTVPFFFLRINPSVPHLITRTQPTLTVLSFEPAEPIQQEWTAWAELFDPRKIALPDLSEQKSEFKMKELVAPQFEDVWNFQQNGPAFLSPRTLSLRIVDWPESLESRASENLNFFSPQPMPLPVETPPRISGTEVNLTEPLSKRDILKKEPLPQPRTTLALRSTIIRIAVNEEGVVMYALVDESCGDSTIDLLAVQTLRNWRFVANPKQTTLEWAKATILWDPLPPLNQAAPTEGTP